MITHDDAIDAAKDAFKEAFKDRFARIASNEITLGSVEGLNELRNALVNLKEVYEQTCKIVDELWGPGNDSVGRG